MNRIVYSELQSEQPKATAKFVGKMFGWTIEKWPDPKMEYYMWKYADEKKVSGAIGGEAEQPIPGINVAFYIEVENIASALDRATSLGATRLQGETAIGRDMGYFAIIKEPGGCSIGFWCQTASKK